MLSKLVVKPIEISTGIGYILDSNKLPWRVQYNINIFQEFHVYEIKEIHEEVEGQKIMEGNVALLEKEATLLQREGLTLHLEDGRKIDFMITKVIDKVNNRYGIKSSEDLF